MVHHRISPIIFIKPIHDNFIRRFQFEISVQISQILTYKNYATKNLVNTVLYPLKSIIEAMIAWHGFILQIMKMHAKHDMPKVISSGMICLPLSNRKFYHSMIMKINFFSTKKKQLQSLSS